MDHQQPHDYGAGRTFSLQQQAGHMQPQQHYGFHPQHQQQQFPSPAHGPPFLSPHPSLHQFPYPRPVQQHQLYPHPPPHPHIHQQPPLPGFPPHMPPHLAPPPFHDPYDSTPTPIPPSDPELQKRIDKLVEYAVKNGPEFESVVREREHENPAYSFLFGGDGHNYYRSKLWMATGHLSAPFSPPFPSSIPVMHPPNPVMGSSTMNAPNAAGGVSGANFAANHMHQPTFPPIYEQHPHQTQPFVNPSHPEYDQPYRSFKSLSRPLPSEFEMEFNGIVNNLTGTKESIKSAKTWFMQRSTFLPVLAEALRDKVFSLDDSERQLHIVYLANVILFDSLQRRAHPHDLDTEAFAFKPVLGSMLAKIYHNPHNKEENQSRLQKILHFWASKEVYDEDTIKGLENEMISGHTPGSLLRDTNGVAGLSSTTPGHPQLANHTSLHWQSDVHSSTPNVPNQEFASKSVPSVSSVQAQQFHTIPPVPSGVFTGSAPVPVAVLQPNQPLVPASGIVGEKPPPYPLFPPGLIPGMVRKMQIGSGVPYSPISPLDIPMVIPQSNVSPSEVFERVSKFFKEIGETNPHEGPIKSSESREYEDYDSKMELPLRKGGACIPPPPSLNVNLDPGTHPDGTMERKSGSGGSDWSGLGATADPNEPSQYDNVYSSYRKQRSTNYHSSISARASAK